MHAHTTFSSTTFRSKSLRLDEELLALIHEGPLEKQPWLGLLKALRERLNCVHANIAFHRRSGPGVWFDSVVDCAQPILASQRYFSEFASLDPIPYQRLVPGRTYLTPELCNDDCAFYREFLQPQGIEDVAMLLVEEHGGMRAWLTLARSAAEPPFSPVECAFVRSLTPHLTIALRTFSTLKAAELECTVYRQALAGLAIGTLLFDQHGYVVRADEAALGQLQRTTALSLVDKRLRASSRADECKLRIALASAVRARTSRSSAYSQAIRFGATSELTLLVCSLTPDARSAKENSAAAVAYLCHSDAASTASVPRLVDLFDLSSMEAELAVQLVRGRTLAEAAEVLQLTEQTARTYSKHIFAKTGTHRQADLVRLILTSVAHLAV